MNKVRGLLAAIVLMAGMTACMPGELTAVYDDEEKIASDSNVYSRGNSVLRIQNQEYQGTFGKFEGMETIWTYDAAKDQTLEFTYKISVYSGKLKLVLVTEDRSVTNIVEVTPETTMEETEYGVIQVKEGENRIRIVGGEDTKVDIELSIDRGEFGDGTE